MIERALQDILYITFEPSQTVLLVRRTSATASHHHQLCLTTISTIGSSTSVDSAGRRGAVSASASASSSANRRGGGGGTTSTGGTSLVRRAYTCTKRAICMNAESGACEQRCRAYGCDVSCFCACGLCETGCVVLGVFGGWDAEYWV